jgi:hypothetical protein
MESGVRSMFLKAGIYATPQQLFPLKGEVLDQFIPID